MHVPSGWRTAGLVAGALLIGAVIGPPIAQAASATLVRIQGARSTHVAAVSKSGQLSVNAGLTTTAAGQVKVAVASPADMVVALGSQTCPGRGFYTVPAGKALIITGVTFNSTVDVTGTHELGLLAGPVANPCIAFLAIANETDPAASDHQEFTPGIPIPAGDAVGLGGTNDIGNAEIYGYLVPGAAVPHNALRNLRSVRPGGSGAVQGCGC